MRYLGIDYGTKRVGLALSDPGEQFAFPEGIVETDNALAEITRIVKDRGVGGVVIGESVNLTGGDNPVMEPIRAFAKELADTLALPIFFENEMLTSAQARRAESGGYVDASAAALILQGYLDRIAHERKNLH